MKVTKHGWKWSYEKRLDIQTEGLIFRKLSHFNPSLEWSGTSHLLKVLPDIEDIAMTHPHVFNVHGWLWALCKPKESVILSAKLQWQC